MVDNKAGARRQADQALVATPSSPQAVSTEGFDPSRDKTQLLVSDADKELAFLELDDLALGRFARSYLIECQRVWKKRAGDKEMPLSIIASMHGALALIRIAHEVNAETYTLTNDRVTIAAQPLGDWKITIKQTKAPAIATEAATAGETTEIGSTEGESAGRDGIAQPPSGDPQ